MIRLILKAILLVWLTWCAGAWVYAFTRMLTQGSVTFFEPNTKILLTELSIACLLTVGGIILLVTMIRRGV